MFYVIRAGFSIYKNGLLYTGGQTIELSDLEFERHKHKFENTVGSVFPMVNPSSNNGSAPGSTRIDRRSLLSDFSLSTQDASYQHLINPNSTTLNIFLPTSPVKDLLFALISSPLSVGSFNCNQTLILPGDRYEIIFDGIDWVEL